MVHVAPECTAGVRGCLVLEGETADEDHDAQAYQDDREEDVFPAFEDFCDRPAGGDESGGDDQHRDEHEEHGTVSHHGRRSHAQEHRNVDADVVAAVGEGDCCDG